MCFGLVFWFLSCLKFGWQIIKSSLLRPHDFTVVRISRNDNDDNFMKNKKIFYEFKICWRKSFVSFVTASQHPRTRNYCDHMGSIVSLEEMLGEVAFTDWFGWYCY
jgi:hypothetical protein